MRRFSEGPAFPRLDPGESLDRADSGEAIIVDVREDEERDAGRIPGSEHVPLGELRERAADLPEDKEIILACRSGNRSSMAAAALSEAGYRAANLEGGVKAWTAEGLPFEGSVA
jgi:rhodanese-related sulfurtransferase